MCFEKNDVVVNVITLANNDKWQIIGIIVVASLIVILVIFIICYTKKKNKPKRQELREEKVTHVYEEEV